MELQKLTFILFCYIVWYFLAVLLFLPYGRKCLFCLIILEVVLHILIFTILRLWQVSEPTFVTETYSNYVVSVGLEITL